MVTNQLPSPEEQRQSDQKRKGSMDEHGKNTIGRLQFFA